MLLTKYLPQIYRCPWLLYLYCCLAGGVLPAQYAGGAGDGIDYGLALQLDLEGIPSGTRPLFAGGSGDGYASATGLNAIYLTLYSGGAGDGYASDKAGFSLAGTNLAGIYAGGSGDGYDRNGGSFAPGGQSLVGLFGGGDGDGYTGQRAALTPGGAPLAQLYGGGDGDGFARLTAVELLGVAMTMLYGGGPGDGFDRQAASLALDGQHLAGLFSGGPGDGGDQANFFGILPLPLTLISFDAFPEDEFVLLRWVTEDEVDTDFFTIEKTRDGRAYDWVGETAAAGYSVPGEQLSYTMRDTDPYAGTSYYRLKTTDFDGTISWSHLVEVQYTAREEWDFTLFPNPNTGRHFNLRLNGLDSEESVQLEVIDASGRTLLRQALTTGHRDALRFDLDNRLAPGSYLIRLTHPLRGAQSKLLIVGH